jgi:cellobiose phosphorylase
MAFARMRNNARAWELIGIINPVKHALTPAAVARYKVEPYVVAADVCSVTPHTGRGGWTWYTGSAGWMYRLLTESLLGLRREGERLILDPCLPDGWNGFTLRYRYRETPYRIAVSRAMEPSLKIDGQSAAPGSIPLQDDGREHLVEMAIQPHL